MSPAFDVIVAGLGAMGSAAAWQLALRGQRVAGFDRFHPPHAFGSSTGRSRIIREAYWESPFYVPLVRRAYALWEDLERRAGRRLLVRTGGIVIGPLDGALVSGAIRSAEAHDVLCERLTPREVRARYPFRPGDDLAAVREPRAGVLSPDDAIGAMLEQATGHGALAVFNQPVVRWAADGEGVMVQTAGGTYRAGCLILAAGAWTGSLLADLRLPLTVARQTMFWLRPSGAASAFAPDRCPVWLWETREGLMYYGFPDLGDGPKVARHHGGTRADPDTVDREVGPDEARELLGFLGRAIPGLHGTVTDAAVCLYTNTPDEHFVVDRHPEHPQVIVASPCSGHGFKFAPTLGEILADLATGRIPVHDLSPFRIARFP